jgi:hypothetical protein
MNNTGHGKRRAIQLALWGWLVLALVSWGAQFRRLIAAMTGLG